MPTNSKQLPAFPLETVPGTELRPQRWEARVLPLCHLGPVVASICKDIHRLETRISCGWCKVFHSLISEGYVEFMTLSLSSCCLSICLFLCLLVSCIVQILLLGPSCKNYNMVFSPARFQLMLRLIQIPLDFLILLHVQSRLRYALTESSGFRNIFSTADFCLLNSNSIYLDLQP